MCRQYNFRNRRGCEKWQMTFSSKVISQTGWSKIVEDLTYSYSTSKVEDFVMGMPKYDAIIFGLPIRYENIATSMKALWDKIVDLWMEG